MKSLAYHYLLPFIILRLFFYSGHPNTVTSSAQKPELHLVMNMLLMASPLTALRPFPDFVRVNRLAYLIPLKADSLLFVLLFLRFTVSDYTKEAGHLAFCSLFSYD